MRQPVSVPGEGTNREINVPNYITLPEVDIVLLLEFVETNTPFYIHSVLDRLLVHANTTKLDEFEQVCLVNLLHAFGALSREGSKPTG